MTNEAAIPQPVGTSLHGAVYLLPHIEQSRFKIGWSSQPMLRVAQLPEYELNVLDLATAQLAWFPLAQRAREAERALHRSLGPYRVRPAHRGDGRTEWFASDGLKTARQILTLLPLERGKGESAQLLPFLQAPTSPVQSMLSTWSPPAETAVDAWYRTEDLWLRLRRLMPFDVMIDGEARTLRWIGLRRLVRPELLTLRVKALDIETYEWQAAGSRRSLVRLMDWEGDDLMMELTAGAQLRRWEDGDAVDDELRVFLRRHAVGGSVAMQTRRRRR